jgi:hypothetical protein
VPGPELVGISLSTGVSADRVYMTLSSGITAGVCDAIVRNGEFSSAAGLYLHYTNNGAPQMADTDGEQLDAIAEHWALPPPRDWNYMPGYFPAMSPIIPIPCWL